jgi:hypothetical protein
MPTIIRELPTTDITGLLYVGMRGPAGILRFTFTAPDGVDFTTAVKSLAVAITAPGAPPFTVTGWTWYEVAARQLTAQWSPDAQAFTVPGYHHFAGTLTCDGQPYDLLSFDVNVEPN